MQTEIRKLPPKGQPYRCSIFFFQRTILYEQLCSKLKTETKKMLALAFSMEENKNTCQLYKQKLNTFHLLIIMQSLI